MSTRACYTFKDRDGNRHSVYVHHDGYPTGAAVKFSATLKSGLAWTLPRFEADEFGAAFIAANKTSSGSVRLCKSPRHFGDIVFHYVLTQRTDGELTLRAESVDNWDSWKATKIWEGTLGAFIDSGAQEAEKAAYA